MTTKTTYQVLSRELPTQRVATIRERVAMTAIGKAMGEGFAEVARAVEETGAEIDGLAFAIYHEMEVDLELGFPVVGEVDAGRVHSATLDGGRVACTVHTGPYEEIGSAYDALTRWVQLHGERVIGPPREVYLNEPAADVVPLTEVQMLIA
ncbi:MAG: GyrI-like domain-containing protein [Actinomycetota bacterium]